MMLLLDETYQNSTPESSEIGVYSEQGFLREAEEFGFKELIQYLDLECYQHLSNSGEITAQTYISNEAECIDYTTGTDQTKTLHFQGPVHKAKYWIKALNYITKEG